MFCEVAGTELCTMGCPQAQSKWWYLSSTLHVQGRAKRMHAVPVITITCFPAAVLLEKIAYQNLCCFLGDRQPLRSIGRLSDVQLVTLSRPLQACTWQGDCPCGPVVGDGGSTL